MLTTFNTGATLLLGPDHQMDMGVSLPITDGADDLVLSLGFSVPSGRLTFNQIPGQGNLRGASYGDIEQSEFCTSDAPAEVRF